MVYLRASGMVLEVPRGGQHTLAEPGECVYPHTGRSTGDFREHLYPFPLGCTSADSLHMVVFMIWRIPL